MKHCIGILLCFSLSAFSQSGSTLTIGSTESILSDLSKRNIKASSGYSLLSSSAEKLSLIVKDFYYQHGELSMSGRAQESENSLFILKGNLNELYGWVILKDKNVAFEYTTDGKKIVVVEQVPVSRVFCVDDPEQPQATAVELTPSFIFNTSPPIPHIGAYPGTNLNTLQSLPGAAKVLYMDITNIMNGETPISQPKTDVWNTWQVIAGGYSSYEVNVTTDKAVYTAAGVVNSGIAKFFNETGRSNSPVNAFGTTQFSTVYKKPDGYDCGRTGCHESGHLMGVYDYGGTPGGTYFEGFPAYKWVPMMGNYRAGNSWGTEALYQWSKGEYATATVKSDFLAIANKKLPYRKDDIPTTTPLKITPAGKVVADSNYGQIAPNTDTDSFTFEIGGNPGHAKLKINRIEYIGGAMLDVDASILDETGKVVATNNPQAIRSASFDIDLPKGKYTLLIKGGAEGTPQTGFSNYSSMGYYAIEGDVTGAVTPVITPKMLVNNTIRVVPLFAGNRVQIDLPDQMKITTIAVFSIDGARMFYSKERVRFIDFSGFAAGMYAVTIGIEGFSVVRKIIKR